MAFPTAEDMVQVPQSGMGQGDPPAPEGTVSINFPAVVCRQCVAVAMRCVAPGLLLNSCV